MSILVNKDLPMDIPVTQLPPGDPRLVEAIVGQLKSKGIFDQFRKECLADVDTKPAYQNLRQRVEGQVNKFLEKKTWKNDMNKNQLRDGVRKHVNSLGILDSGIDAIISQVVNPKIKSLILPYVEDTVYAFLQIDKPKRERKPSVTETLVSPVFKEEDQEVKPKIEEVPSPIEEKKPDLLPMETDVISSEEDDILARESPEEGLKSSSSSSEAGEEGGEEEVSKLEEQNDNAQDGFEDSPPQPEDSPADAIAANVERLQLSEDDSKSVQASKQPLPLFDDQSLDSISSNSSGLTFSPLTAKDSPESKKSSNDEAKSDASPGEMRSATSTPLVDEKPVDEPSQSPLGSDHSGEFPSVEKLYQEDNPPSQETSSPFVLGLQSSGKADKTEGGTMSCDEDSRECKGSSKASIDSGKLEICEKTKSDKSEGEISSSSSEMSDGDVKGKQEHISSEGKQSSDHRSSHKSSRSKSDHKKRRDSHSQDRDRDREREREREKDSRHHRDKERKHSKSRDDHHSHRDKDRKHHRRDKDHDGDKERSRSHHYQSSSSSHKESSGSRDKERSSHHSSGKSSEGKSRSTSNHSSEKSEKTKVKGDGKSHKRDDKHSHTHERKSDGKSERRSSEKSDKKVEKHDRKSEKKEHSDAKQKDRTESQSGKSEVKSESRKAKREPNDSKPVDTHECEVKSESKKAKKEPSDSKLADSHECREKSESKKALKEPRDSKSVGTQELNNKLPSKQKLEKVNNNESRNQKASQKDDDGKMDQRLDKQVSKNNNDNGVCGDVENDCDVTSQLLQLNGEKIMMTVNDGNFLLLTYDTDSDSLGSDNPLVENRVDSPGLESVLGTSDDESIDDFQGFETAEPEPLNDFQGFESVKPDTRLADYMRNAIKISDDIDKEDSQWFSDSDFHLTISEESWNNKIPLDDFLRCMCKLGAVIKNEKGEIEEYPLNNKSSSTAPTVERNCDRPLRRKRKLSNSSSVSSTGSSTGSPKHKRYRRESSAASDTSQSLDQDSVIVSGYALLTPEDDGNRSMSREYDIDYSQKIPNYSPLSPASDSSADESKGKNRNAVLNSGGPTVFKPSTDLDSKRNSSWSGKEAKFSA